MRNKFSVGDKVQFSSIVKDRTPNEFIGVVGGYHSSMFPIVIYNKPDSIGNLAAVLHDSCLELAKL